MAPTPQAIPTPTFAPAVTVTSVSLDPKATTSLITDASHTESIPGIGTSTITLSNFLPSSSTTSDSPSDASTPILSTGIIIGITVGVFSVLATCLILFMHIRNKKKRNKRMSKLPYVKRSHLEAQKRLVDAERQRPDPFIDVPSKAQMKPLKLDPTVMIQTAIPNPFLISPVSRKSSHSRLSPLTPTLAEQNVQSALLTGSGGSQLPTVPRMSRVPLGRVQTQNTTATMSLTTTPSEYGVLSAPSDYGSDASAPLEPLPNRRTSSQYGRPWSPLAPRASLYAPTVQTSKSSEKAAARARELRAMQVLIEALESGQPQSRRSSLLSFSSRGRSRLSAELGLGGEGASRRTSNDFTSVTDFSLPPAELFRAGLGLGKRN